MKKGKNLKHIMNENDKEAFEKNDDELIEMYDYVTVRIQSKKINSVITFRLVPEDENIETIDDRVIFKFTPNHLIGAVAYKKKVGNQAKHFLLKKEYSIEVIDKFKSLENNRKIIK